MSDENDGVLSNLPRSRPGVRSDKRASAKRAGGTAKPRAAKPRAAKPRAAQARAAKPPPPPPPPPPPKSDDPLTLALGAATQVAETGLKVAVRVAGEVLRRLPRP